MIQSALVILTKRPLTGPAAQAIKDRGFIARRAKTAARASSSPKNSLVLRCGAASIGAPGADTSANRALVPPMSHTRSGKGKFTASDFQVENFDGRARQGTFRRQNCRDEQPHDVLSICSTFSSGQGSDALSQAKLRRRAGRDGRVS